MGRLADAYGQDRALSRGTRRPHDGNDWSLGSGDRSRRLPLSSSAAAQRVPYRVIYSIDAATYSITPSKSHLARMPRPTTLIGVVTISTWFALRKLPPTIRLL